MPVLCFCPSTSGNTLDIVSDASSYEIRDCPSKTNQKCSQGTHITPCVNADLFQLFACDWLPELNANTRSKQDLGPFG